jgi:hydrogenase nickel incorporation protein HypA/HybF
MIISGIFNFKSFLEIKMHELGIARDILEVVNQYITEEQMPTVRSVRIRLGTLSGIVPESLSFCFEAIVADTPMAKASLEIIRVPTKADCTGCGNSFEIEDPAFLCSQCGGIDIKVVSGTELQVVDIEIADGDEA